MFILFLFVLFFILSQLRFFNSQLRFLTVATIS
jgi:hypothetical protein